MNYIALSAGAVVGALALITLLIIVMLRRVVPTNEVHIVQSAKATTSYGRDHNQHTYYQWPSWVPKWGVVVVKLPVSVFDQDLSNYEAYDSGRLPFVLDVKAFFRVADSALAAQRVASFDELRVQLKSILQGAIRTILASHTLEEIMQNRSEFGTKFTKEVDSNLREWGVCTVKNIELMDIRDNAESQVIANIMAKQMSFIAMESRVEVANNGRAAEVAEIEARQIVAIRQQEAQQLIGIRTAEQERAVGIAGEQSKQYVQEEAAKTADREASTARVKIVRKAEIDRERTVIEVDAKAQADIRNAEGMLKSTQLNAEGVKATGEAEATASKLMQLAPVEAQIVLAKEIGGNEGYQTYLVRVDQVKALRDVGIAQAGALEKANIKVIATGGTVPDGVGSINELFSANGGTKLGAMLEAFGQTDTGKTVLGAVNSKLNGGRPPLPPVPPRERPATK